jgi:carboxymethylenebutenolidase
LYDDYAHNRITRLDFVQKLSLYAVGGITVSALMSYLMPDYVDAIQIKQGDPRITESYINYPSPKGGGNIKALLCMPAGNKKKLGGVVVVHENRGLNPHIADIGRRVALAGFVSLSPDALSPLGGYPGNDDAGREMQSKRNRDEMLEDFIAAAAYLKKDAFCNGKIGTVGFCFGGWIANMMAVRIPDLAAAVPFYGGQPSAEDVPNIKAPLLIHYGELDTRVNEGWPAYEAALKANNKAYTMYMYAKANHGFNNDTTPRYDKDAAELAWKRTIDFFTEKLK